MYKRGTGQNCTSGRNCTKGQFCTRGQNFTKTILNQGSILHVLQFRTEFNFCTSVKNIQKDIYKTKRKKLTEGNG